VTAKVMPKEDDDVFFQVILIIGMFFGG